MTYESNESKQVQKIEAEWDSSGVHFYQAYKDDIADYALEHQKFGGPSFNPERMTWIKPSLAWMLFRSGYGRKHGQNRVLKVKLSHETVAFLLTQCKCEHGSGGSNGRVQWDPARDIYHPDDKGKAPRIIPDKRAIQIGLKGPVSKYYVDNTIHIQEVTALCHKVQEAHSSKSNYKSLMQDLKGELPNERNYDPQCSDEVLKRLGMLQGETSEALERLGLGKTTSK